MISCCMSTGLAFSFSMYIFIIYAVLSTSLDNYLAMEVACTMVCPKANKEVITVEPDGLETQKCEKCEGECPKGMYVYVYFEFQNV